MLQMKNISKTFLGVKALDKVDFSMGYGEVHGLMGENGAGKSTLIKILTGMHSRDKLSGPIIFDGKEINPVSTLHAQSLGISTIYQEVNLVPYLSVSENILLGREPKKAGFIDWKAAHKRARDILSNLGIEIDVRRQVREFNTAIAQMITIARAISVDAKLLVMDEPTSSLDSDEVKVLFEIIRSLKEKSISILFIGHRISEIFEITDRLTILKDGVLVGDYKTSELTKMSLVSKMIGRTLSDSDSIGKQDRKLDANFLVEAKGIKQGTKLKGIDVDVKRGEVLGLAGLLGSGRTELAKVLFGDTKPDEGTIEIDGRKVSFKLPRDAIKMNFAFCPEDRKLEGIVPQMSVKENLTLAYLPQISKGTFIKKKQEKEIVEHYIGKLQIKAHNLNQRIDTLSGGNQQKVVLARWMCMGPSLIILDEPTRGIDVGAKAEVEKLIQEMAAEGIGVLMISSELEELVRCCDRVVVLRDGKKVGELYGGNISEDNIMRAIAEES